MVDKEQVSTLIASKIKCANIPKLFAKARGLISAKPPRYYHCGGDKSQSLPLRGMNAAKAIAYELMIQMALPPSDNLISRAMKSVETKRHDVPKVSIGSVTAITA